MPRSPRVEDTSLPVEAVDVSSIDGGIPFPTFDAEEQRRPRRGSRAGIWNEINASRAGRGPIIKEVSLAVTAPHLYRPRPFLARHLLTTLGPRHTAALATATATTSVAALTRWSRSSRWRAACPPRPSRPTSLVRWVRSRVRAFGCLSVAANSNPHPHPNPNTNPNPNPNPNPNRQPHHQPHPNASASLWSAAASRSSSRW